MLGWTLLLLLLLMFRCPPWYIYHIAGFETDSRLIWLAALPVGARVVCRRLFVVQHGQRDVLLRQLPMQDDLLVIHHFTFYGNLKPQSRLHTAVFISFPFFFLLRTLIICDTVDLIVRNGYISSGRNCLTISL